MSTLPPEQTIVRRLRRASSFSASSSCARGGRSHLGLLRGAVGIARLNRRPRIAGRLLLHVGARKRHEGAIPPPGSPRKAGGGVARVEAGPGAERHQHFRQRDAALIEPVGVRLGYQRLERFANRRRHLIGNALGFEPAAEVKARRTQVTLGQTKIGDPRKGLCVANNRDQRAVGDARIGVRWRLNAVANPSVERQHQRPHDAVVVERVDAVGKDLGPVLINR